jgi:hypothetical protein
MVIVLWPEGLFYATLPKLLLAPFMGGNSRGQNGDIEPVVHIPKDWFVKVRGFDLQDMPYKE